MRGTGMHNVESGLLLCFVKVELERGFYGEGVQVGHWDKPLGPNPPEVRGHVNNFNWGQTFWRRRAQKQTSP